MGRKVGGILGKWNSGICLGLTQSHPDKGALHRQNWLGFQASFALPFAIHLCFCTIFASHSEAKKASLHLTKAMTETNFKILPVALLPAYCEAVPDALLHTHRLLEDSGLTVDAFSFYTSVAVVFSSKIEGEDIELDSYVKHKRFGIAFQPDYTRKIDDLYNAYQFAKTATCNQQHIEAAHRMLTAHILPENRQGKTRTVNMYVTTPDGRIEYVAASPYVVQAELEQLYHDLDVLLKQDLSVQEVFFFASLLHLVFVKIHPFDDGNGRAARLLEKWFLASKLGEKAWLIQSEKNYYENHQGYYHHIRMLGLEYEELDYAKALPFLLMLPGALDLGRIG